MTPQIPPYRRGGGFGSLGVRFSEVIEPPSVSFEPATVGAWITLAGLTLLVAAGVTWLVVRYARRGHRRLAQRELESLARARRDRTNPALLEALPSVLKRCALVSFSRASVASLSGERWRLFLDESCPGTPFSGNAGQALVTLTTHGASALSHADEDALLTASRIWVRRYRARI
ncbi:MAG TPA: DUF4381 domain-containing protein [Polyangiaceae bacterium]|nr:DUF4381 domain-containing protein [Polyangiaceae bacterium]